MVFIRPSFHQKWFVKIEIKTANKTDMDSNSLISLVFGQRLEYFPVFGLQPRPNEKMQLQSFTDNIHSFYVLDFLFLNSDDRVLKLVLETGKIMNEFKACVE